MPTNPGEAVHIKQTAVNQQTALSEYRWPVFIAGCAPNHINDLMELLISAIIQ